MSTAKNAVYAVVGAGRTAIDEAKALPKRAAALPGLVGDKAQAVPGFVTGTFQTVAGKAKRLPSLAGEPGQLIKTLPKSAGKAAKDAADKVRSFASEAAKDATKRFEQFVVRGEKTLARNGSKNGKRTTKARKPSAPKTVVVEAAPVSSPAAE